LVNVLEVEDPWANVEYGDIVGWIRYSSMGSIHLVNVDGPTPPSRGYHQMTYDVESDRVILFGGLVGPPPNPLLNDTWSYEVSTNTWTKMAPAQSPAPGEGPLAYDIQSDRAILFLGTIGWPPEEVPSETWAYDFNTDTWTNLEPSTAPPPLLGERMVYDEESNRMILFGGIDSMEFATHGRIVFTNETWAYDFDANTWTQMEPEVSPPGVNYFPMAYDAGADRIILIGSNALDITDDTWIYDYNTDTWEARQTTDSPKHRDYSAMVYAAGIGQTILFGEGEPVAKNDTWAYDFDTNTWTQLEPDGPPSERGWHAMAYSSAAEQVILFGGGRTRERFTLETWVYDPQANTWTNVGP
jgi:N-acetylneuraminic acid mutarotase